MNVEEFTTKTLNQVTEAIRNNESTLDSNTEIKSKHGGVGVTNNGWTTIVEFDLVVTLSAEGKGGTSIDVAFLKVDGGGSITKGSENRVKFKVPIKI